jgi:hypothetical protein
MSTLISSNSSDTVNLDKIKSQLDTIYFSLNKPKISCNYIKRVKNECETLFPLVTDFKVSQNNHGIVLSFKKTNNEKNIHYSFIIGNDYPFKCPDIIINGTNNQTFMKLYVDRHIPFLKQWKGIECFCCQSLFCSENWGPIISFKQIINEIEKVIQIKGGLVILILIEKIKKQYLINDIDLFWWIYK